MPNPIPLEDSQASEQARTLFAELTAKLGRVPNMYRTLGYAPQVLQAVNAMGRAIRTELDAKVRELAYLKTVQMLGCKY